MRVLGESDQQLGFGFDSGVRFRKERPTIKGGGARTIPASTSDSKYLAAAPLRVKTAAPLA